MEERRQSVRRQADQDLLKFVEEHQSGPSADKVQRRKKRHAIRHASKDDPPTLMIHGDEDKLVPLSHSERILAAFEEAEVTTNLIVIEGAGHGFRGEAATEASAALLAWFQEHLTE